MAHVLLLLCFFAVCLFLTVNTRILISSRNFITASADSLCPAYTAIIPGAGVYRSGKPSPILSDRLEAGLELYRQSKVQRFLLSGDHGTKYYDEVNHMRYYLRERGVPDSIIFTDHAGFDTYNTMYRAVSVFGVSNAIVVTQEFHLKRAVFIARLLGIKISGYVADRREYSAIRYFKIRESFANIKAYLELLMDADPYFGGATIPINGNASGSHDRP